MKRTYSYDKLNRPTVIEYTDNMSGSTITVKEAHYYEYDKSSQITRQTTINCFGQRVRKQLGAVFIFKSV